MERVATNLVQEIFLKLCQQDRMPEHPKEWLSLTGYRLFVDRWRRNKRAAWLPLDYYAVSSEATPEQALLDKEFETLVLRLLLRFKPRMRTAFYLRIFKQFSYGEFARKLGCSENTVKSFIRRGKAQLANLLLGNRFIALPTARNDSGGVGYVATPHSIDGQGCTIRVSNSVL
ncbi:RNA polymerase sigma factor [Cohnella sp.]|uniref:RNA polymerase sigma factor n=1 Tax=Cohnella sp. TaxID=1883426 RepID=UPI00356709D8